MREDKSTEPKLYSVSEAVQKCGMPSHVLRYWEEELDLPIQRTAQGHRIYSEEDLATFRRVKELKNKGIQLKAIRLMLDETEDGRVLEHFFEQGDRVPETEVISETVFKEGELTDNLGEKEPTEASDAWDSQEAEYEIIPSSEATNYQRFESMLRSLVSEAVAEQNEKLEQALAELIRDEIEDLYIQLCQDEGQREAAVAGEQNQERQTPDQRISSGRIRELLKRTLKNLFHV